MDENNLKKDVYNRMQDPEMLEFRKMLEEKLQNEDPAIRQKRIDAMSGFHMTPTEIDQTAANTNPDMPIPVGGMIGSIARKGAGGMVPAAIKIPVNEFANIAKSYTQKAAPFSGKAMQAAPRALTEAEMYLPKLEIAIKNADTPEKAQFFQGLKDRLLNSQK